METAARTMVMETEITVAQMEMAEQITVTAPAQTAELLLPKIRQLRHQTHQQQELLLTHPYQQLVIQLDLQLYSVLF